MKRDTRTPEQILADLKARAAAKIEQDVRANIEEARFWRSTPITPLPGSLFHADPHA